MKYGLAGRPDLDPGAVFSNQKQQQHNKTNWTSSATNALRNKKRIDP